MLFLVSLYPKKKNHLNVNTINLFYHKHHKYVSYFVMIVRGLDSLISFRYKDKDAFENTYILVVIGN